MGWEAGEGELHVPQFWGSGEAGGPVPDGGVAWDPLPLSSPSPGGFTEETKRKVLDTLGFQSMQLEQSTWCVAQPSHGGGRLWHCHPGPVTRDALEGSRGVGYPNAPSQTCLG